MEANPNKKILKYMLFQYIGSGNMDSYRLIDSEKGYTTFDSLDIIVNNDLPRYRGTATTNNPGELLLASSLFKLLYEAEATSFAEFSKIFFENNPDLFI